MLPEHKRGKCLLLRGGGAEKSGNGERRWARKRPDVGLLRGSYPDGREDAGSLHMSSILFGDTIDLS